MEEHIVIDDDKFSDEESDEKAEIFEKSVLQLNEWQSNIISRQSPKKVCFLLLIITSYNIII